MGVCGCVWNAINDYFMINEPVFTDDNDDSDDDVHVIHTEFVDYMPTK